MDKDKINKSLETYLGQEKKKNNEDELDCSSGVCVIKNSKGIVERINKTIMTEDGRQLLT